MTSQAPSVLQTCSDASLALIGGWNNIATQFDDYLMFTPCVRRPGAD